VPQTWTGSWTTLKKLRQELCRNSAAKLGRDFGRDFNDARNIGEILLPFALPSIRVQDETEISEIEAPPLSKELKKRWSYFIRKVYETDPLTCPKCQGEMRIISYIDLSACTTQAGQLDVIKPILQHLGLWEESQASPERLPPIKRLPSIHPTASARG